MPKEKIIKITDKISTYFLGFLAFAVPLFFLPTTRDFYNWNKQVLIISGGVILLLLWTVKAFLKKDFRIFKRSGALGKAELALISLPLLHFISSVFNPNYVQGLTGRTMLFVGLLLIYFSALQLAASDQEKNFLNYLMHPLLASVTVLSIINILGFLNIIEKVISLPGAGSPGWSPVGGQFALITITLVILPLSISTVLREFKKKEEELNTGAFFFSFISVPLFIASLAIFSINIFETQNILKKEETEIESIARYSNYIQLPLESAWKSATGTLGNTPKTAFLGVGTQNFENAFKIYRPASLIQTHFRNIIFNRATNEPLHLIITTGLLGFISWAFLCFQYGRYLYNLYKDDQHASPTEISLAAVLLIQVILPPTLISWFLIYLLFSVIALKSESLSIHNLDIDPKIGLATATAFSALVLYLSGRAYAAKFKSHQATLKLQEGLIEEALNLQRGAITLLPGNARYHYLYSRTTLGIAQSLDQTEESAENIRNFLQASQQAAEKAININPANADYWKNRGDIFWNLLGLQEGSVQEALNSYNQAVVHDPLNPTLRVLRGRAWAAKGDFSRAQNDLVTVLRINPNLASAWFNLAIVLEGQEDFVNAAKALEKTLELLPEGSQSYNTVQTKIEELKKKASATETEAEKEPKDEDLEEILEQDIEKEASPSATPASTPQEMEATSSAEQGNVEGASKEDKSGSPFGSLAE